MKRTTALILMCLLIISAVLTGCSEEKNDYLINNSDSISIGVLLSTPEENNDYLSGITYAAQLAHSVNLDKPYEINLKTTYLDSADNIQNEVNNLLSAGVSAIICEGKDKSTTDAIINSAEGYNTPLLFIDNYSDAISNTDNAFSISVPYSYQVSAVTSHLIGDGKLKGALICSSDDDYNKNFAKLFETTFASNSGIVTAYYYSGDQANFNANTISASGYDFVFIIGNSDTKKQIFSELMAAGVTTQIVFSEITDKKAFEASDFNNVIFISKFESDDNNYIGTDFINTYTHTNNLSISDVTASVAYGYDAYMTIYDSLVSLNNNSIFQPTDTTEDKNEASTEIYASDVTSAIKNITHMGVTDVIRFNDNGLTTPSFVYTDKIENAHAGMLNRYNYSDEQN